MSFIMTDSMNDYHKNHMDNIVFHVTKCERMRLEDICRRRGRNLYVVNEAYTSRTCGRCGEINKNLGGKKYFVVINVT